MFQLVLFLILGGAAKFSESHDYYPEPECRPAVTTRRPTCIYLRHQDIQRARSWYKLTTNETKTPLIFPFKNTIPWLDQTIPSIGFYYALDPFESRYLTLARTISSIIRDQITPQLQQGFKDFAFQTEAEYVALYRSWNRAVSAVNIPQYFSGPDQFPDFTSHITNGYWKTDEAFTQRRLAGTCPLYMRKVVQQGTKGLKVDSLFSVLASSLVKTKDTLRFQVGNGNTLTLNEAIESERLFVQYIEDMDNARTTPDILRQFEQPGRRKLSNVTSPISLFILKNDGNLAIIAIQSHPRKDSDVLFPDGDPDEWLLAKGKVEGSAIQHCQAKIHLAGIHFVIKIYCLSFRRHLSTQHPLYDFLKYHCEGTVPHIKNGFRVVSEPNLTAHIIFQVGYKGVRELSRKAYDERDYEGFTFESFIEDQGMDDERIKYYPFRDDAKLILDEYENFANDLVCSIYTGRFGNTLKNDKELQSWANELSIDGKIQPDGGKGKMIGFPNRFTQNHQLVTFIKRFLWYNLLHTAVNYALPEFSPVMPSKLYERTDGEPLDLFESVGGFQFNLNYVAFVGLLANFRSNRIFNYYNKITDYKFRNLLRKYHFRMHKIIQAKLSKRNAERKKLNQLGFQYLEPKWLTNSIHI